MPLRHLIVLIANVHDVRKGTAMSLAKRPASRDLSGGAVRRPIIVPAIERRRRHADEPRSPLDRHPNTSSLYDFCRTGGHVFAIRKLFTFR